MSNKVKRKITVNLTQKGKAQTKNRPSVFERLGIKAGSTTHKEYCHHWAQNGSCPYGKGCKYSATHTLISPSKQRAAKIQTEPKKRHAKDDHKRLPGAEEEWDQWDPDELEDADPDDLERKRQELQRELELQMKMEHKARKKEKKIRKESSPSSDSSSTSSDTSSSSEESSSSSSTSIETKRKKLKKSKPKRPSSSSSEERSRKHKKNKHLPKAAPRDKSKKTKTHLPKSPVKSPSPIRIRKKSETPPIKPKTAKKDISEIKSPRPLSRSSDRKEKHHTPSPKTLREKEREKEREREKEKEREREKEKEKEKEREREREREKEKEKERERERERERAKQREKEREREKKKDSRSPRRDNKSSKDIKRRDSPDSSHSRDRKISPNRSKTTGGSSRRDQRSPDRRDKRDERARSRIKDRSTDKSRKDKRDSRDRDRDRDRRRDDRDTAREKEREEALARCQERQRERERLKELEKKENERRARDRGRREDRGLDKPSGDRVERLLPLPEDRIPPGRRHSPERDRDRRDGRGHSVDTRKSGRNSPERHDRVERDLHDRNYDRERGYDRDHEDRGRDYGGLSSRMRDERRLDEKDYGSPYDRARHEDRRYMELDDHYNEAPRDDRLPLDRDYVDDRRGARRDIWDLRDERVEMERGRSYRGEPRAGAPALIKGRDWVDTDYAEHEWDARARRPHEWENSDGWDNLDRPHPTEEEWRHYNRGMDNWPPEERRRWPNRDWRERDNSRPRSSASHNVDSNTNDSNLESRRKDASQQRTEPIISEHSEPKQVSMIPIVEAEQPNPMKRVAEEPLESSESKKLCLKSEPAAVLEDDLSEISDDADDILNRDEEIADELTEEPRQSDQTGGELSSTTSETAQLSNIYQKSQSPARSPSKSVPKEESLDGDNMDLDFEEISEDELDEESRIKGIGDALGVDWASLVAESRSRSKPTSSAKLRWEAHNVLINIGVSVNLAGEDLVKDILKEHAEAEINEQNEEKNKSTVKSKTEITKSNMNGINDQIKEEPIIMVKEEIKEECIDVKIEPEDLNISHPIAAIQVANQEKQQIRRTLFSSVGPHRRALSARRDLTIRRHLCNLPINDAYVEAPKRHDPELFKIATQLFERCL